MNEKKASSSPSPKSTYKVFVSSTYLDNQDRRQIVQDVITRAGMVWHGMELFAASTRPTVEECLRYVGLIPGTPYITLEILIFLLRPLWARFLFMKYSSQDIFKPS